jgi:Protein of unknown function (DUF1064)
MTAKYVRNNKFGAIRADGYASKAEARRGAELDLLAKAKEISQLRRQPWFVLLDADKAAGYARPLCYVADFEYYDHRSERMVIEDVKGFPTPSYLIKKRLMKQLHGLEVTEIRYRR